jgi:hypothetical protein
MMRLPMFGRSTQLLVVANVAVAMLVTLQLLTPATPGASATEGALLDNATMPEFSAVSLSPPALSGLAEMLERPLFFTNRRMPVPEKAEPPPPPTPLRLKLVGIAISGGSRVALLRNQVNNQLMQLAEGENHDGWSLDAVSSQAATFSRGPQVTQLPLEPEGSR